MAKQRTQRKSNDVEFTRRAITINRPPSEVAAFWREYGGEDAPGNQNVRFVPAPGNRGTEVHLERAYERPGLIASVIATFKHDNPSQREFDELFALKQILETGDTVTSDAWANGSSRPRPAQPIADRVAGGARPEEAYR
jgi:uncharacterized membrane protein